MQLKLNRITATVLLIIVAPIVLPMRIFQWMTRTAYNPQYDNSIEGSPMQFTGHKPIIISVWAKWATTWKTITDDLVSQLRAEYGDRCEFAYIEITEQAQMGELGLNVVPTVILRHKGNDIDRFPNMISRSGIDAALSQILASANGGLGD